MSPQDRRAALLKRFREGKRLSRRGRAELGLHLLLRCTEESEHICTALNRGEFDHQEP